MWGMDTRMVEVDETGSLFAAVSKAVAALPVAKDWARMVGRRISALDMNRTDQTPQGPGQDRG
jgi:cob(I)alamin adenosyltransferase